MRYLANRVFDFTQSHLKTDIRYLVKGGFWTTLGYIIQVGLGVVNTIVLANLLAKDLLGTYQFILAMAGILGIFTLSGMGTAITQAVAKGHEEAFRSGTITKLKWSTAMVAAALSIAGYYWYQDNSGLALAFLFVACTVPLTESFVLYESYLQGKQAFKDSVTLGIWRKPLPVVALFITLYFTTHVPILIGVYLGTTTLATLFIYRTVIKKYQPPKGIHPETIVYSKHLSLMNILSRAAEHADKVLLWYLLGPVAVASFTIAQLAVKYSGGLTNVVSYIALPKVAQRDLTTLKRTLPRKIFIFTVATIPFMLGYMAAVPFVFSFLFPNYPESIPLAQVLGLVFLFLPRSVYGHVLVAHKQTRVLYIGNILVPISRFICMTVLIYWFGIWGAVYALIINDGFETILGWYFVKNAHVSEPINPLPQSV